MGYQGRTGGRTSGRWGRWLVGELDVRELECYAAKFRVQSFYIHLLKIKLIHEMVRGEIGGDITYLGQEQF